MKIKLGVQKFRLICYKQKSTHKLRMTLFYCYYYFCLLLLFHTKYLQAYSCHVCDSMYFNYSITTDNLPSPTSDGCQIITAETGCFARVDWYNDQTSAVLYGTNPGFPRDTVIAQTRRGVNILSGLYIAQKYVAFICGSLNSMPCNTVDNLRRSIISTTFPTEEQIKQFDELIAPAEVFNSSLCFKFTNMTDDCSETDLLNCQQCIIGVEYSQETNVCAACPDDEAISNFFSYDTTFLLNNRTQSEEISLTCQRNNACNSMENIEDIRKTIKSKFDFNKFFHSTASITKSSLVLLVISLCMELFLF
jgi:hypothetical protein